MPRNHSQHVPHTAGDTSEFQQREKELEGQANRLLQESIARMGRGEYPFYTQYWIRRQAQRDIDLACQPACHTSGPASSTCQGLLRMLDRVPMRKQHRRLVQLVSSASSIGASFSL